MSKKEDGKLLKVLSCRYRESSGVKTLKFCWEPCGTLLYYKRVAEGWLFSTEEINELSVPVRKGSCGKNSTFTYINVRNIIAFDGDVAVYRQGEHTYLIKPATEEQLIHRQFVTPKNEGDIRELQGETYYIHLNKTRYNYIFGDLKFAKMHVVNDDMKAYIEASPATEEDIKNLPTLANVKTPYGGWQTLSLVDEYTYIQPMLNGALTKQKILCPISFMRNNNKEKEPFMVWQKEDGTVILEPHPLKCDVCGKQISRYKDVSVKGYTCGNCHKALPKIKQLITTEDFDASLKNIRGVQSLLESIMN